jgi:hypothetical protein
LQTRVGGGYHFAVIKDPIGNELRVHKDCVKRSVGEGYSELRAQVAAQQNGEK